MYEVCESWVYTHSRDRCFYDQQLQHRSHFTELLLYKYVRAHNPQLFESCILLRLKDN